MVLIMHAQNLAKFWFKKGTLSLYELLEVKNVSANISGLLEILS